MYSAKTFKTNALLGGVIAALAVLMMAFALLAAPVSAWANNNGTDTYYRVNDFAEYITEGDEQELSKMAKDEEKNLQFDFQVYITTNTNNAKSTAQGFYEKNDCGYGQDDDGIILCYNPETNDCGVYACGLGTVVFSDKALTKLEKDFVTRAKAGNGYDAIYGFLRSSAKKVAKYQGVDLGNRWPALENDPVEENKTDSGATANGDAGSGDATERTTDELSWYPKDPSKFVEFHNPDAPRVVDNADLLTDEEEAALLEKIKDMESRLGITFVFLSDTSSYGLSRALFADDFYTFNGYGVGDEYDGVIYFVCMEPGNRGFVTEACGGAQALMTEDNVNHMDDETYGYFKSGEYSTAINTQFENLDVLYTNGKFPFDWAPIGGGAVLAFIISCIAGVVRGSNDVKRKKSMMKTVAQASYARQYIINGPVFTTKTDRVIRHDVRRTPHVDPPSDSGGSSSGGGRSSYSSGHHSSGGSSHHSFSGGGRSF